jgi:hypothetical protein
MDPIPTGQHLLRKGGLTWIFEITPMLKPSKPSGSGGFFKLNVAEIYPSLEPT